MAGPAAAKDKNAFGIANPALSGAAYLSVSRLVSMFGWEFIEKLKANGAKMGQGSGDLNQNPPPNIVTIWIFNVFHPSTHLPLYLSPKSNTFKALTMFDGGLRAPCGLVFRQLFWYA